MATSRLLPGWIVLIGILLSAPAHADLIHDAARDGATDEVRRLLLQGVNVNGTDASQKTALHYASEHGHDEVVVLLLSNGADVNHKDERDQTALIVASARGRQEIVEHLLAAGADVNHAARDGVTAVSAATSGGYAEVVRILLRDRAVRPGENIGETSRDEPEKWEVLSESGQIVTLEQWMNRYEVSGVLGKRISPTQQGMGMDCPVTIEYRPGVRLRFDPYCRLQAVER